MGIGWLEEEFQSLGIPFKERARRTEECIQAMRSLWAPGSSDFVGEYYGWNALESNPKPVQGAHVPIIIGGHVEAAARRAARIGDGLFPALGDIERLRELFVVVREECERIGRDPNEVELSALGSISYVDDVQKYEAIGVSRIVIPTPSQNPETLGEWLEDFSARIIRPLSD